MTNSGLYIVMFAAETGGKGTDRKLMQQLFAHCAELGIRKVHVTLQSCLCKHDGFFKKVIFLQTSAPDDRVLPAGALVELLPRPPHARPPQRGGALSIW